MDDFSISQSHSHACPCVQAYSTSALYYKTGGGGRVSSLAVASLLLVFLGLGPSAIEWFPRPLAGCLLLHLGTRKKGGGRVG